MRALSLLCQGEASLLFARVPFFGPDPDPGTDPDQVHCPEINLRDVMSTAEPSAALSLAEMVNVARIMATVQKVVRDPRPYVVASAPVCLMIGTPLAITGTFMLVGFGFSAFIAAFSLITALILLSLGLLPLAVQLPCPIPPFAAALTLLC